VGGLPRRARRGRCERPACARYPADQPADAKGDWSTIERILGTGLPADFRELIETYGSGTFGGSLRLFNPRPWLRV